MRAEKILKRVDGSRVKIVVLTDTKWGSFKYKVHLFTCEKNRRTWERPFDRRSKEFVNLDIKDQERIIRKTTSKLVSSSEIYEVKMILWNKIRPIRR